MEYEETDLNLLFLWLIVQIKRLHSAQKRKLFDFVEQKFLLNFFFVLFRISFIKIAEFEAKIKKKDNF